MTTRRMYFYALALTLAPIIVAWFDLSVFAAVCIVIALLFMRWLIVMSGWAVPEKVPELELETISISHFVEKVRWSMDLLNLNYTETVAGGTLGAFYRGRTVPQLRVRTGAVRSTIGNSKEILRYLWGRYAHVDPARAAFLAPTPEREALEDRLDQHGRNLQVWAYYRILDHRSLTLRMWGADDPSLPQWQRWLLRALYPVQSRLIRRAFSIGDENFAKAVAHIESLLSELNTSLADGRESLLKGDAFNYTDITLASYAAIWLMPEAYAAGKAAGVRINEDLRPEPMQMDIDAWQAAYPLVVQFTERLYAQRLNGPSPARQGIDAAAKPA